MNIAFHDADRIVAENFRERRQVDSFFGMLPKIVRNKLKLDPFFFRLLQEAIVGIIYPRDVLSGIPT